MRIGVFDSGIGGLGVLKELLIFAPNHHYIYLADNKNIPFGSKSIEELINISEKALNFFIEKKVDIIVIACNTLSTTILERIRESCTIPLIGIHEYNLSAFAENHYRPKLLLATERTVSSNFYQKRINNLSALAVGELVMAIENNDEPKILKILKELNNEYDFSQIEILLGCTHFIFLKEIILKNYPQILVSEGARLLAKQLASEEEINKIEFYYTASGNNLKRIIREQLKLKDFSVKKIKMA